MLSAVVLAAGESRRMDGVLKALLPLKNTSFLGHIVRNMARAGVDETVVVAGYEHARIAREVRLTGARLVVNENWPEGQLSSLRAAVRSLSPLAPAL